MRKENTGVAVSSKTVGFSLVLATLILCILLAGCGGGSGGGGRTTPSYNIIGVGVIKQSQSDVGETGTTGSAFAAYGSNGYSNPAWKKIILSGGFSRANLPIRSAGSFRAAAVTPEFLSKNESFILLNWSRVNGADHYRIFYADESEPVWYSNDEHGDDPQFDGDDPQAYLDLNRELDGRIAEAGNYQFRVVALNGSGNVIHQFPAVTVSLGMILMDYPKRISYDEINKTLSWDGVGTETGGTASGYRVQIFEEKSWDGKLYDSPADDSGTTPLLSETNYNMNGKEELTDGSSYRPIVDAWALDSNGNPVEITRGVGDWFSY